MEVVEERPEPALPDAGDWMGHEPDRVVAQEVGDATEVAPRGAHVGVAHHQEVVARLARQGEELVHLGVQPGLAPLHQHAKAVGPPRRGGAGHGPGGIGGAVDAEQHLVERVVEVGEGGEVGLQVVVDAAERLQHRGAGALPASAGRRRRWRRSARCCSPAATRPTAAAAKRIVLARDMRIPPCALAS